ncbi:MAG: hypothetical protein AYK23_03375 [Candidatus Proteinoplasmatales archaeon SG8-5]|nr:MAG: hypothetical protein AYK23_03375 [Candidatus Proteinoplasmatales archaeon SG8-5]
MKGAHALIVGMCLMFLVAVFSPLTIGENDSLHVVMIIDDRKYSAGDLITVELRVYDGGTLVNADGVNDTVQVTMTRNWEHNNHITVTMTNQGVGIYRGSYTVGSYDVDSDDHHLYFYYHVERGGGSNPDNEWVEHYHQSVHIDVDEVAFSVNVNFEGQNMISARPGDTVTATILAKFGTSPVGDGPFNGVVLRDPDDHEQNISTTFVSTGLCRATFTIPQTMSSGLYRLYAQPSIAQGAHGSAWINVNVLDVWYHKLSSFGESVSFEVCVADSAGQPVNGATIVVHRQWQQVMHTGTTNATGKALMSLTDVNGRVLMQGYVLYEGYNQTVEGFVYNPQPEEPHHHAMDIIWRGNSYMMEAGDSVTIPYTAFLDQEMMGSQVIHYYVTAQGTDFGLMTGDSDFLEDHVETPTQVVAAGTVTTSPVGEFSLSFTTPSTQSLLSVVFEVPQDRAEFPGASDWDADGNYYEIWPEHEGTDGSYFYVTPGNMVDDDEVTIKGGSFRPGEEATVTVSMAVSDEDWTGIIWGPGEFTADDMMSNDYDPAWASWTPGGTIVYIDETEAGEFEGNFIVPAFIDTDSVSISGGYTDVDTGLPHYSVRTAGRAGGIDMMLLLGIVAIVVIVVVVVVVVKTR